MLAPRACKRVIYIKGAAAKFSGYLTSTTQATKRREEEGREGELMDAYMLSMLEFVSTGLQQRF
eukprot:527047-Pelagomonas_calceolata.AAC.2